MTKKIGEVKFVMRTTRELASKLDYIAAYYDRSRNSEINQAVKRYILAFEEEHGKIVLIPGDDN